MYPLNDNDLDRLGREAAEQYDVDQNTSGWEALESRLNKELPLKEEKERRRFLFWLFFIALIAGGSLWYLLAGNQTEAGRIAHVPTTNSNAKNTNPSKDVTSPNAGIVPGEAAPAGQQPATNEQGNATPAETKPVTPATEDPAAANEQAARNNKDQNSTNADLQPVTASGKKKKPVIVDEWIIGDEAADYDAPKRAVKKRAVTKKDNKRPAANTEKAPLNNVDDHGVVIGNINDDKEKVNSSVTAATDTAKANEVASEPADTAAVVKTVPVTPPVAAKDSAVVTKKPTAKKDNKKVKGFEIGIIGGPDMSNVKFTHTDNAGYNVGLQLGYRFSNQWSVNTGLIYTKKNYVADGKDVTKYGYFARPDVTVSEMEGYCNMWDIPLNVRYDFSVNQKRRLFASAGLSTYIMNRENYDYNYYTTGNPTPRIANWDSKNAGANDSTYLFSVLNLSAGFERALSKKISIQVEPYLKVPLSQLGHGRLNMYSYGIHFGVKYRIAK